MAPSVSEPNIHHRKPAPRSAADEPPSLTGRAASDLHFIRAVMQRSTRFMPLPGWGITAVGGIGAVTAVAARNLSGMAWAAAWCGAAALALLVAVAVSSRQSREAGKSIFVGSYRAFWLSLWPAFGAAIPLSAALLWNDQWQLLAGSWLLLYGTGVSAASQHTVPQVAWLGRGFMILGVPALFLPWPTLFMAAGFGGLHLVIGIWITRSDLG
ncbi:MAG: hypothetical protein RLZZ385_93 [Pseudomonadota bacterium]|jgi:hypothetical protein